MTGGLALDWRIRDLHSIGGFADWKGGIGKILAVWYLIGKRLVLDWHIGQGLVKDWKDGVGRFVLRPDQWAFLTVDLFPC